MDSSCLQEKYYCEVSELQLFLALVVLTSEVLNIISI